MKLSSIPAIVEIDVKEDGSFSTLGFVDQGMEDRLVFLSNRRALKDLEKATGIAAVLTTNELAGELDNSLAVATCPNPREGFFTLHNHLAKEEGFYLENGPSVIDPSARIHSGAHVAEINVSIGRNVIIEPGAVILEHSILDEDVIIRAGAVIGSEGFQIEVSGDHLIPVAHGGGVRLHKGVEIQSGTRVDRSLFGTYTEIGEDTKIDNLVHIAHNDIIGKRCLIAAGATLSGSVTLGDDVWIGPGAVLSNSIYVGSEAKISLGSVVVRDVQEKSRVTGNFAIDHSKFMRFLGSLLK